MGLRDIGDKTAESIDNLDPATIGDIVSDIEATIIEIRGEVSEDDNKVDHLYRLFRQLTKGEPYEGKLETEEEEEEATGIPIVMSGLISNATMKSWKSKGNAPMTHPPEPSFIVPPKPHPHYFGDDILYKTPPDDISPTIKEPVVNTVKKKKWFLPKIELRWW